MKTKVVIAGIGGVGGYFGGLLATHFNAGTQVEVIFWARGEHLAQIRENGLRIIADGNEFVAIPALATNDPGEIGVADVVIVATKSYDLESVIGQLKRCIGPDTIILPLLNGVDSRERIKAMLPDHVVLDGCVYIVSRLKQPGVVERTGNMQNLYFGLDGFTDQRLLQLEHLLKEAGIQATLSDDISKLLWEKFIFISPTATATSFFDKSIGEMLADEEGVRMVHALIREVKQLAEAKGIPVAADTEEKAMVKLKAMPFGATSSMHSDFRSKKNRTELQSLTGYVLDEARKYGIETPAYAVVYPELKKRGNSSVHLTS